MFFLQFLFQNIHKFGSFNLAALALSDQKIDKLSYS